MDEPIRRAAAPSAADPTELISPGHDGVPPPPATGEPVSIEPATTTAVVPTAAVGLPSAAVVAASGVTAWADPETMLSAAAAQRVAGGLAASTRRAYTRHWGGFHAWCEQAGRRALPATAATLAEYVSHLAITTTRYGRPPAPSTIELALGCIQSAHRVAGHTCPVALAKLALRDYRRERARGGYRPAEAPPVDLPTLRAMVACAPAESLTGIRDRFTLVLGLAMMGRRGEAAALDIADLRFRPEGLEVHIRASKTDQDAVGETVALPYGSHPGTCPVRLARAWLATLAEREITTGPLLRSIDQYGRLAGTPGFAGRAPASGRISGEGLNRIVRDAARRAGLDDPGSYTFHSLRAGGATAAAKAGKPATFIQRHGRWKSVVFLRYIRKGTQFGDDNAMTGIGL
jgi:integrase